MKNNTLFHIALLAAIAIVVYPYASTNVAQSLQNNITYSYNTTVRGNLDLFGDIYVRDSQSEILNITIYSLNASPIGSVNLSIPKGINVTASYPPASWGAENTTDGGGTVREIRFLNTSAGSAIMPNGSKVFSLRLSLNATKPADGQVNFTLNATDYSRENALSENFSLIVDTVAPQILCHTFAITGYAPSTNVISSGGSIYLACESEAGANASGMLMHYSGAVQDANWTKAMYGNSTPANYSATYNISALGSHDGKNQTLMALFEDMAGNKNSTVAIDKNVSIDTWPPGAENPKINGVLYGSGYYGEFERGLQVSLRIDSWDNTTNITGIFADVTALLDNGTLWRMGVSPQFKNISGVAWELNYTNTSDAGTYNATIVSKDEAGLERNTTVWFDIYEKTNFSGNVNYNQSASLNATLVFLKPNASASIHRNATLGSGAYNITIGKRKYDAEYHIQFPSAGYTNGETQTINISALDTNLANSTNDIMRALAFGINSSRLGSLNNTLSVFGVWINSSIKDYTNNIELRLNLSRYGPAFNINGTALHICNAWDGNLCAGTYELEPDKTIVDPAGKTIAYRTRISDLYQKTNAFPADRNGTIWLLAFEPKNIRFEVDTMISNANANITLKFFRQGTGLLVSQALVVSDGLTNLSVYNETYDMRAEIYQKYDGSKNIVDIFGASMPSSAGSSENVTDALKFKYLDYCSEEACTQTTVLDSLKFPPNTVGRGYSGLTVIAKNLVFSSANITLNYTKASSVEQALGRPITWANLRMYKCAKDDPALCETSDWSEISSVDKPTDKKIVIIPTANFSTYVLTQYQAYNPPPVYLPGSSSGGGSQPWCGDKVCSIGEDPLDCPKDCGLSVTCGNKVCDFFENIDNCPLDCTIRGVPYVTLETTMSYVDMGLNSKRTYDLWITNNKNETVTGNLYVFGEIGRFVQLDMQGLAISNFSSKLLQYDVVIPESAPIGYYTGDIIFDTALEKYKLPISMTVSNLGDIKIELFVKNQAKQTILGTPARFSVEVSNMGAKKELNLTLENIVKSVLTNKTFYEEKAGLQLSNRTASYALEFFAGNANYDVGSYYLVTKLSGEGIEPIYVTTPFEITNPFWSQKRVMFAGYFIVFGLFVGVIYSILRWYQKKELERRRYLLPADDSKIPQKSDRAFLVGNVADTKKKAWFNAEDLVTHILVAGSTGSGKSVSASIFAEEALKMKIPVVVFDPTAQWTGFVKACKDENLLKNYAKFNMKAEDAKPFKGMIFEVTDINVKIDIKKYMAPGEVTVFNLAALKPGEYDQAVMNIVQTIFDMPWEEATELKLLIVFDEVHRLLEKYGGKGGYIALEKACREFRKWGIGLIMVSQVSADFKEAVQGNILTEVQLNTKSIEDIGKIKSKYGEEFAKRITKQAIGVGIIQNPRYNDGKPWFVAFRPTLHEPHKLGEEELKQYASFARDLDEIEKKINEFEKGGVDTTDIRLEFRLASDKLKSGRFRMAEIYLNVLKENLKKLG